MKLYAHTSSCDESERRSRPSSHDVDVSNWQPLQDHLNNVADIASGFASTFGYKKWGLALGELHDAGKASDAFQRRLRGSSQSVDHSTAGAKMAVERYSGMGQHAADGMLMAFAIAGHHGQVPNGFDADYGRSLHERLEAPIEPTPAFDEMLKAHLVDLPLPSHLEIAPFCRGVTGKLDGCERSRRIFSAFMFDRMLYSCLVDADYIDTENCMTPSLAEIRKSHADGYETLPELLIKLEAHMVQLTTDSEDSCVNRARASVLDDCREAARSKAGIFTLTVPTGGGKTLASLMFALAHAVANGQQKVIYAIPFTSIVEQTADVFRSVLGAENVLEHHSNHDYPFVEIDSESVSPDRMATENWDAPIIVTTNVQLLESLYSNRPSRSRKVHSIARSVVILDEAQKLPDELLTATLAALEDLVADFGSSVVLCTATQPAVQNRWPFGSQPREIVTHRELFEGAFSARSRFVNDGTIYENQLVQSLSACKKALCIVDTKAKARRIFDDVRRDVGATEGGCHDGVFHLSAWMTPNHRTQVLDEIRIRLNDSDSRCVVISTQLIEAGVDIDFPLVYRELAGIDSLLQAAGRCNREGQLRDEDGNPEKGIVHVFELNGYDKEGNEEPEFGQTIGTWLGKMRQITKQVIARHDGQMDPTLSDEFFEARYQQGDLDARGIYGYLSSRALPSPPHPFSTLPFQRAANDYKIIDDDSTTVFVLRDEQTRKCYERLRYSKYPASMARELQRYSVSIRNYQLIGYEKEDLLEYFGPIVVLNTLDGGRCFYSDEVGLLSPQEGMLRPLIS